MGGEQSGTERITGINDAAKVQLVIAEFTDRRTEINNRTTAQHVLISLNITAAGAIAGVVLTMENPDRSLLLLLVPVCSALAMLWADHALKIRHIGWYIRHFIRPLVEAPDGPLWKWEVLHSAGRHLSPAKAKVRKWVKFGIPVMLTFIGPPLFGLLFAYGDVFARGTSQSRLAFIGAGLLLAYGTTLLGAAVGAGDKPAPSRTSSGRRSGSASGPS